MYPWRVLFQYLLSLNFDWIKYIFKAVLMQNLYPCLMSSHFRSNYNLILNPMLWGLVAEGKVCSPASCNSKETCNPFRPGLLNLQPAVPTPAWPGQPSVKCRTEWKGDIAALQGGDIWCLYHVCCNAVMPSLGIAVLIESFVFYLVLNLIAWWQSVSCQ